MFSDHSETKLEINYKKDKLKIPKYLETKAILSNRYVPKRKSPGKLENILN